MKSASFPLTRDEPMLGEWQRLFLVELYESKYGSVEFDLSGG